MQARSCHSNHVVSSKVQQWVLSYTTSWSNCFAGKVSSNNSMKIDFKDMADQDSDYPDEQILFCCGDRLYHPSWLLSVSLTVLLVGVL